MDHLDELRQMIHRLLTGEWTLQQFDYAFGQYYYKHIPVEIMRSAAAAPYNAALEQLEFIKVRPTAAERAEGWMDPSEYVAWLRERIGWRVDDS